jgi:beta-barrel assembly-enhancing protease
MDNKTYFPPRAEYSVNTSEFNDVKARVAMLHNRRKPEQEDANSTRLRRAPGSSGPIDEGGSTGESKNGDDRPTLKRRPDGGGQ